MSVLQIDYYKNGQFKGASGASIFQSSNSQSSIAFKFEDDIEDAIVFANILLPYPENSQLYGQYKAQSLIMEKKVDPNGGYIYIGQLLAQYLQTNGKAYVNAQIQASEGLYKFQSNGSVIIIGGVIFTYSISNNLLVLTNNLTGKVYNQVNAGVITVENEIYKITELSPSVLKMETGFTVDNYQRVEFKITASEPYYAAMPMTPEESMIFADAISKNQYDIVQLQQDKQDKEDPNINPDTNPGDNNDHTVVGNINTLLGDTAQNTDDIGTLQNEMSQAQQNIHDLQVLVEYGVNIVGEMTTIDALPTDAQVSAKVEEITGEPPVRGQAMIVRVDYTAGTDTIYLYVFDGGDWKHFEMQFLNDAGNGIKGLIAGNYNAGDLSTPNKFMVNISNGRIIDIVRVDPNGNYVALTEALDLIIAKVLDTSTGAVNRAKMDANGNNIANTYQTKQEGASKDYVKQYASPKALYDLNYPDYALGQFKSVEVSDTSYNKTTNSTSVGYTTLATITKSLEADILLGDQNGLINRLWISANITEDVKLRITTAYIDGNNQTQTLSVEETGAFGLVTGIAKLLQIESVFSGLTQPITLPAGTTLVQTIEVWREASASADFTLLSNTTYNAYMTLNKIGYVRYSLEQEPDAIITGHDSAPTIDSDGDLLVQSTDGEINYKNGASAPLTTIVKVPMASGINQNDVRPPKAGDVKTALDGLAGVLADKVDYIDISSWTSPLTSAQLSILENAKTPILLTGIEVFYPKDLDTPSKFIFISQNSGDGVNRYILMEISKIDGTISLSYDNVPAETTLAPLFSTLRTYAVGDLVTYGGDIYKCTTAVTTAGDFDPTNWTQVDVSTLLAPTLKNKGVFNQLVLNNYISYTNNAIGWFNFNSNANISNGDKLYITLEASNINNPIILGNSPTNNSQTIVEKSDIIINTKIHKIATANGNYNFINTYFEVNNVQLKNFNIINLTALFGAGAEPTLAECQKLFKEPYYEYTTSGKILVADNDNNGFVVEIGKEATSKKYVDDSISATKLWENPNPTSAIGLATITTVDMSPYLAIIVEYKLYRGAEQTTLFQKVAYNYSKDFALTANAGGTDEDLRLYRGFQFVSATSLLIRHCYANQSEDDNRLIPIRIYGTNIL